jgi:hypothetical protein
MRAPPDADELIHDTYNAVSAAYGRVNLGFDRGAELADPAGLLVGTGARILARLVRAAIAQRRALAPAGGGATRVRPTSGPKRRPRR